MSDCPTFDGTAPLLSTAAQKQLSKAISRPASQSGIWRHYIRHNLLDLDRCMHTPLLPTKRYTGWRHSHVEGLLGQGLSDEEILQQSPLFAVPLRIPQHLGGTRDGRERWERPADRAVNGGYWVFTLEMDEPRIEALERQLAWCRSPDGKPQNSPIGQLDRALSAYRDYRGVTAVYSGGKSVHFHFVFDIRHLSKELVSSPKNWLGDLDERALPGLYTDRWLALVELATDHLGQGFEFDTNLSSMFQLRRTPGGIRVVDGEHLLELEPGTKVVQCVLLDLVRSRATAGATEWFIRPEHAAQTEVLQAEGSRRARHRPIDPNQTDQLLLDLTEYLREEWQCDYPRPVSISDDGGQTLVRFLNHPGDRQPGTMIAGPYRRLLIRGQNAPDEPINLPHGFTLDQTLDLLRGCEPSTWPVEHAWTNNWWERCFAGRALSKTDARNGLGVLERLLTDRSRHVWIKSVEGIGKTHTLLTEAPYRRFDQWAEYGGNREPGFLVFACRSYDQAADKCAEFNAIHSPGGMFHGIVLRSFSDLYRSACRSLDADELSVSDVVERGHPNLFEAVSVEQADVLAGMTKLKNKSWDSHGTPNHSQTDPLRTVIFTVHSLVQNWPYQRRTRAWLHPDYSPDMTDDQTDELSDALTFSEVIYDEVGASDLIDLLPQQTVDWCEGVRRSVKPRECAGLSDQFQAYQDKRSSTGHAPVSFEDCRRIMSLRFTSDDLHTVKVSDHPFGNDHDDNGLYRSRNGDSYYMKQRDWWRALGAKITFLTTEELPTTIAENLNWPKPGDDDQLQRFRVYRFDQSAGFIQETVSLILDNRAAKPRKDKPGLSALIPDLRQHYPSSTIITDKAPSDSTNTLTHQRAHGRNDLSRTDLITILQYLNPARYAELCLLGTVFGIDDVIRVHYRDDLFQALGRNRGMRRTDPAPEHLVVMSHRLFRDLGQYELTRGLRYQLVRRRLDQACERSAA